MSFDVNEVWRGEALTQSADGNRTWERKVQLIADNSSETLSSAKTAFLAFLGGTVHPDDASAYLSDYTIERGDNSRIEFWGTASYEFSIDDPGEDPLDKPPTIRWATNLIIVPVLRDFNGYACTNSAGDYFDPPLEAEIVRLAAVIQFNAASVPVGITDYAGAVNNASITIDGESFAADRCRIASIEISEEKEENGTSFRSVTIAVECRSSDDVDYDQHPLDQGFRVLADDTPEVSGTLTTRTSDTVGTLTMSTASHGIATGDRFTLRWSSNLFVADGQVGSRRYCLAGTVSGTSVPFTLGTGKVLPAPSTSIKTVRPATYRDVLIEDEDGNQQRPSAPVLLNGLGKRLTPGDGAGFFMHYIVTRKADLTVFPGIT